MSSDNLEEILATIDSKTIPIGVRWAAAKEAIEFLLEERALNERGWNEASRRLDNGTLHVDYCNASPTVKVGAPGSGCSCPLGQEIRRLRYERDEALRDR